GAEEAEMAEDRSSESGAAPVRSVVDAASPASTCSSSHRESRPQPRQAYGTQIRGVLIRAATPDDLRELERIRLREKQEFRIAHDAIQRVQPAMRLVRVEHLFGGERVIVYYLAEDRVDFRELVRVLAGEFQTRVEMRQIGVRDEARLLSDYGDCGREICCNTHLSAMPPVSMRMAKLQKATLDPTKISGRCGRLKCCLRYEYDVYEELLQEFPPIGLRVRTPDGEARVVGQELLAGLVCVEMRDERRFRMVPLRDLKPVDGRPGPECREQNERGERTFRCRREKDIGDRTTRRDGGVERERMAPPASVEETSAFPTGSGSVKRPESVETTGTADRPDRREPGVTDRSDGREPGEAVRPEEPVARVMIPEENQMNSGGKPSKERESEGKRMIPEECVPDGMEIRTASAESGTPEKNADGISDDGGKTPDSRDRLVCRDPHRRKRERGARRRPGVDGGAVERPGVETGKGMRIGMETEAETKTGAEVRKGDRSRRKSGRGRPRRRGGR
ncbi:MAG: regulatory iron-sulfur-containing complex subunit RicT, partial [Planctomycetia bacterium]|nr:regulatory iron-sulfur-containing complex subunit RicT [Planctomycetia bacterium]